VEHAKHEANAGSGRHADMNHYGRLVVMMVISFLVMYVLMYAMVDRFANVYGSVNQFYMAGLMTAPMAILELALMGSMYQDKRMNVAILVVAGIVLLGSWFAIRTQAGVGDRQFVRSMIPHHAGAILMCKQNKLQDPELQRLCANIIASQQAEIELMKAKLQ